MPRSPTCPSRLTWSTSFAAARLAGAAVDDGDRKSAPKSCGLQLGVRDDAAAARAEAAGLKVVINRCPAIEIPRLGLLPIAAAH